MASVTHTNGSARPNGVHETDPKVKDELLVLNLQLKNLCKEETFAKFHGDALIGDNRAPKGFMADMQNSLDDIQKIFQAKNMPTIMKILGQVITFKGFNMKAAAPLVGSMSNDSHRRKALVDKQVKAKYQQMLHPPLTYLGDAFQYRTPDGKFNNVMSPHLGQAGAPYAKTVPSVTHPLGALPDPGDIFDRLMVRQEDGRQSKSGLSSMLIYHATIIIHDIFRTNEHDKNISDSSSYLDLSPLYGYTLEMQKKIRDGKYKLGLLKPDVFAEDRLLRQPPGVCIMLVMYNRYHNYAATQLRRINENGRFSVPNKFQGTLLEALARRYGQKEKGSNLDLQDDPKFAEECDKYNKAWKDVQARQPEMDSKEMRNEIATIRDKYKMFADETKEEKIEEAVRQAQTDFQNKDAEFQKCRKALERYLPTGADFENTRKDFEVAYQAAWDKLDDDLFNTARLITCGMYIQVSIHDYLRALMGFHQWNTNFTLEPRADIDHHNVSRGIGNQVTVEFNLLYRFHCAISLKDEEYTKRFIHKKWGVDPDNLPLEQFIQAMKMPLKNVEPWDCTFGIPGEKGNHFVRDNVTGLFNDQDMINALTAAMDDPISNFGPRNVPKCLRAVEILGIVQARKWQIGTLNDFRDFFGMSRHETFESVTKNVEVQNALRDLYEHPDKIEFYPGVFCESDENMGMDPGPSDVDSALWAAIFSDAITLVRSDRFYTTDWNTNSLTSWGMREVTPDNDTCKSSVFHRLIQRAFPGWFPYDSVQFFHPFYTRQTNAKYAAEQGYAPEFRMSPKPAAPSGEEGISLYDVSKSTPQKPWKPVYLDDKLSISYVLNDKAHFIHPALNAHSNFPDCFQGLLKHHTTRPVVTETEINEDKDAIMAYFTDLMREIIKRESISMSSATLQIDATRDFAIPVVTRYVADFLGFGHLIRCQKHPKAPYSENEIYQHIENCQVFMSYNADETKLLKRRRAFKISMQVLHDLVLRGNIGDANRWGLGRAFFGIPQDNVMTKLGHQVADRLLGQEGNLNAAASMMVFAGLHTAYNAVLGFTSALNNFLTEMYEFANPCLNPRRDRSGTPRWLEVQRLAFQNDDVALQKLVVDAERRSIKLPIVLIAKKDMTFGKKKIKKDNTVICDIFKCNRQVYAEADKDGTHPDEADFVTHKTSATDGFAGYQPKHIADVGVTAMIKVFAHMRNARRGHDAQGKLKKIRIDGSSEGYSNFMAPMRIERISERAEEDAGKKHAQEIYTPDVLRPETDTYLTAEWNEMVPFPNTWKIRFDGFGASDYSAVIKGQPKPYGKLRIPDIADDEPPFYQPKGPSHTGGTFADTACICHAAGLVVERKDVERKGDEYKLIKADPPTTQKKQPIATGCGYSK